MRTVDRSRFVRYAVKAFLWFAAITWITAGITKFHWAYPTWAVLVVGIPAIAAVSMLVSSACVCQRYLRETSPRYRNAILRIRRAVAVKWERWIARPAEKVGTVIGVIGILLLALAFGCGIWIAVSNIGFQAAVAAVDSPDHKLAKYGRDNWGTIAANVAAFAFLGFFIYITWVESWLQRRRSRNASAPTS